jgi:hypothetical protein
VSTIGVRPRFFLAGALLAAAGAFAQAPQYRLVTDPAESAQPAALQILKHLVAGELEAAAALSNAPERRLEVLRQFRGSVGEEQFRELFGRYFAPENRIVMEAAIGTRRLLVWDLGEANHQLAGQYFVELEGRFVTDDVPSAERAKLEHVLRAERTKTGPDLEFRSSR